MGAIYIVKMDDGDAFVQYPLISSIPYTLMYVPELKLSDRMIGYIIIYRQKVPVIDSPYLLTIS